MATQNPTGDVATETQKEKAVKVTDEDQVVSSCREVGIKGTSGTSSPAASVGVKSQDLLYPSSTDGDELIEFDYFTLQKNPAVPLSPSTEGLIKNVLYEDLD